MHFGCVDFPNELVKSRQEGNLVVFAGAGVSVPAPSNLPDFRQLSIELAHDTTTLEKGEPLDRFLGRLDKGLRIHERTRDRLRSPDSEPNPLHFSLLKLFGDANAVRLVTTNFDNHFATAADEIWAGESLEMFVAPALPAGGDFLGLVHLHGSVTREPRRMVLTDTDFGKAYLTEGWARRFLQEMFLKYTVLFVGYSHRDPVMHYLARGLPSSAEGRRFALTTGAHDRFWRHLGILALAYPIRRGRDSHREQKISLAKWVTFTAERPLDKRERIREIVSKLPPPSAGEDHDYLVDSLSDVSTARFFTEFATIDWFEWMQGRDRFLRLFRKDGDPTDTDEPLAQWFAQRFTGEHTGRALEWIARNGLTLGTVCWRMVACEIVRRMHSARECTGLDKWVPLLIQARPVRSHDQLEDIVTRCRYPEDSNAALSLFQHLLRPVPKLEPDYLGMAIDPSSGPDVDLQLATVGDSFSTGEAWQRYFRPNLHQFAGSLASIVAAHLEEMALLSKAYGQSDFVSVLFSDITATSAYGERNGLGVLVEVARETMLWLIQNARKRADGLIEIWWNAGSIVLQRLAVLGVAKSNGWTADDKLAWLLERDLLYKRDFRTEVSAVLTAAFRDSSPEMVDRVVDAALTVPAEDDEHRDALIRERLWMLKSANAGCPRVAEELSKIQLPTEYVQQPEPAPPSPADLLVGPPTDQVDKLLAYESKYTERRDRGELAIAVQRSVAEQPDRGLALAAELRGRAEWKTVLWKSIVVGWNQDGLTSDQWARVLNLLADSSQITSTALDEIIDLLELRTSGDSNPFRGQLFGLAVKTGFEAWRVLESREPVRREEERDWSSVAINDAGGRLTQFCLRMLWLARKEAGDSWRGLTDDFRLYLENVIRQSSWAAEMARVVIAAHLQMLFALDAGWTRDNVFPLFDWYVDARRAQQAWHGFLTWGGWDNDMLEQLLPRCRATFARIDQDLGDRAEKFCELMASIALYGAVDPMTSGWLKDFIRTGAPKVRRNWSSAVCRILKRFPEGKRREVWARWMRSYWEFRLEAGPPLDSEEIVRMVEWSIELENAFPEAVGLVLRGPAAESGDMTRKCRRLLDSGVWRTCPRESALLLRFLVQSQSGLPFTDCIVGLVKHLKPLGAETSVLVDICQRLAELGDANAEGLKQYVESQGDSDRSAS